MIKFVEGDILNSKAQVIAHSVAANDDFKTGLALQLRERWPAMYKDFRHYCQSSHPKAGTIWTWSGVGAVHICSLFTQEGEIGHHGSKPGPASLPNVTHALKALRKELEAQGYKSVALPRMATGVGGLAWKDVEPLINEYLNSSAFTVYVYQTYHAGVTAKEV